MRTRYSKEEGLKLLKENIEKLGHIPTRNEYQKLKLKPSASWLTYNFEGFEKALNEIGIKTIMTKEDLIIKLQNYYKENGKVPTSKDAKNPSAEMYYSRFKTKSWNKILEISGLKPNHIQGYTEEYLLQRLDEFCEFLGRNPRKEDFKKYNWLPSDHAYQDKFGGILKSLKQINRLDKILDKNERFEVTLKELRELATKLNRVPTVEEYDNNIKYGYDRRSLERIIGLTYNDTCRKYIPEYKINLDVIPITKEDCKKDMEELVLKLGRVPSRSEVNGVNNKYTIKRYFTAFDTMSYYNILIELGYEPNFKKIEIKDDDTLLDDFYKLYKKIGRVPYSYEIDKSDITSSYGTYMDRFGSLQEVCSQLNIDYFLHYRKSGAGVVCKDKNNEACKSIPEMDITNFFIENNLLISKENYYNELIDINNKYRFDWKIKYKNKTYFVEYLGMYNVSDFRGDRDRKYTIKAKRKMKLVYKQGKINECIFITKSDYEKQIVQQKIEKILKNKFNYNIEYSNRNEFSRYNQMTNEELLNSIMKYSNNNVMLPSSGVLISKENGLYTEVKQRFGSYEKFAIKNDKLCLQRREIKDKREQLFSHLAKNYKFIGDMGNIRKIRNKDVCLRGLDTELKECGILNFKIKYFTYCVDNQVPISCEDLLWLDNVKYNGKLINKEEQEENIKFILTNTINKEEFIQYKQTLEKNKNNEFVQKICSLFLYMKRQYGTILPIEEYQQLAKEDTLLKSISLPNFLRKHNKIMIEAKLMFYKEMMENNNYIFNNNDIEYLRNIVDLNKMKVGKLVNENHKCIAEEIIKNINKIA